MRKLESEWAQVNAGVPQGTLLGPVCFLFHTNDPSTTSDMAKYEDDSTLLEVPAISAWSQQLQLSASEASGWAANNKMAPNLTKPKRCWYALPEGPHSASHKLGQNRDCDGTTNRTPWSCALQRSEVAGSCELCACEGLSMVVFPTYAKESQHGVKGHSQDLCVPGALGTRICMPGLAHQIKSTAIRSARGPSEASTAHRLPRQLIPSLLLTGLDTVP